MLAYHGSKFEACRSGRRRDAVVCLAPRRHAASVRRPILLLALVSTACGSAPAGGPDDAAPADAPTSTDGPTLGDGGPDAARPVEVAVLSQNLHCLKTDGTAYPTNAARFAAIAAAVAAERIDVVLAQELCVGAAGDARALMHEALARATGVAWTSGVAATHRAWVGTPDEADEYVAVFARGGLTAPRATAHRVQGSLRRVLLGATVTGVGDAPLRVYTVHLDHEQDAVRAAQGRDVATAAMVEADDPTVGVSIAAGDGAVALPIVIGGDFNSTSEAAAARALVGFGFVDASAAIDRASIDHVFVHRSAPLATVEARTLFVGAAAVSDHPGVLVRFASASPTPVRLTRITAPGSFAPPLTVRGDRAPLTWSTGWPAWPRAVAGGPGVALVTSELPSGGFEYKFLRGDVEWQVGANATGVGQADNQISPMFP